jgi:hypothetical protein
MSEAKCPIPTCQGTKFDLKEIKLGESGIKAAAVICDVCGAVIQVFPPHELQENQFRKA